MKLIDLSVPLIVTGSCGFINISVNSCLESQDQALPQDNGKPPYLGAPWIWTWKLGNKFARFEKEG